MSRRIWGIVAAIAVAVAVAVPIDAATAAEDVPQSDPTVQALADTTAADPGQTVIRPFADGLTRLAGSDRYSTAIAASQRFSENVPAVFVATGSAFPDALSAAAAAALVGGPLLLTASTSLPGPVLAEIRRLAPKQIYVIGGVSAVSDSVFTTLRAIAPTERLSGGDRYATGLDIVNTLFDSSAHAILATGRTFPDALAATGAAGADKAPVILVDGASTTLSPATMTTLSHLEVTSIAIAGGNGAVSAGIENQLRAAGYSVARYGGGDRYSTAALINRAYFPSGSSSVFVATGENFPDALAGAALAGRLGAPMFTTTAACAPAVIADAVRDLGATKRVVMGGTSAVSDVAASNTTCLTAATPTISGTPKMNSTLTAHPGAWTAGTSFQYQWYASGGAIGGATAPTLLLTSGMVGKRITVTATGTNPGFASASKTSAATAAVTYPLSTTPSGWACPSWAPIKGNANSGIYHVPGGRYYDQTNPEACFSTEAAARDAGYRKSKL